MKYIFLFIATSLVSFTKAQPVIAWNQFYSLPNKTSSAVDCKMSTQGNVNLLVDFNDTITSKLSFGIVQFDPNGQIVWQWLDTNLLGISKELLIDQNDNLYILSWNGSSNHVIKIDGSNGASIFDYPLDSSTYTASMWIDSASIFIAQSTPDLLLTELDHSGALINTIPLDYMQRVYGVRKMNNTLVLIADSLASLSEWYLVVHHIDLLGNYIDKISRSILSPTIVDIEVLNDTNLYVTGSDYNFCPYLFNFNLQGMNWDTIICSPTGQGSQSRLASSNNQLYWSYIFSTSSGAFNNIHYVANNSIIPLTSLDSARAFECDLYVHPNDVIYSINAHRESIFQFYDSEINAFDKLNGVPLWNLKYSVSSATREQTKFLKYYNGSLFIIGDFWSNFPNWQRVANVLRLDNITSFMEINGSQNFNYIYPNPNNRVLFFKDKVFDALIEIVNLDGKIIYSRDNISGESFEVPIELHGLSIVKITSKTSRFSQRIVLH